MTEGKVKVNPRIPHRLAISTQTRLQIPEQKLKAFSIGVMGKRVLSKKELEEQRKKEEEKAAAHV